MVVPHRLMPYPYRVITEVHGRYDLPDAKNNSWMQQRWVGDVVMDE